MTARSLTDPDQYIGTVTFVNASIVQANLPDATARPERRRMARGAVGDFVFIDCDHVKLLGRIIEVRIPDAERMTVEPSLGTPPTPHPIGRIKLLATVEQINQCLERGVKVHPRVGDGVFLAPGGLFAELVAETTNKPGDATIDLGMLDAAGGVSVRLSAEKIFGRHCGVFGATGGGKSWTLATLLNQIKVAGGRAILFDPTGEFANIPAISKHYTFNEPEGAAEVVHFPYERMTEDDLFMLCRPSGLSQGPKLREAVKSLKLVRSLNGVVPDGILIEEGCVVKRNQPRATFNAALGQHRVAINTPFCTFNIEELPTQIVNECVWSTGRPPTNWGDPEQNSLSHCETLVFRLRTLINAAELSCLFRPQGRSLVSVLEDFFTNDEDDIIRISFRNVRFEHHAREILLNVVGRYLLDCARRGRFRQEPIVVFLDEAHQFLGRTLGDEYASVHLEAFGLIAKEGRKYGLACTLATQRPRDIPADVMSQLGTLIVHRLTNDSDRETVERACGDLDRDAATFIPILAPGEAILIGPDVPAPVPLLIHRPSVPPDSAGPPFGSFWAQRLAGKSR